MRNLLALGGAALLIFLGLGWYLDWYRLKVTPGEAGHRNINIDVNTNEITEDLNKAKEKVRGWLATKDQPSANNSTGNTQTVTPGNTTSFRPNQDGSYVYPPSDNTTPTPPTNTGPRLPTPR